MVGGIVTDVIELPDLFEVSVVGTGSESMDGAYIYVARKDIRPEVGDPIWWQSNVAMITKNGVEYRTEKVGHSVGLKRGGQ